MADLLAFVETREMTTDERRNGDEVGEMANAVCENSGVNILLQQFAWLA